MASDGPVSIPVRPTGSAERQALAEAVRRLMAATVTSLAPSELLADATATLSSVADRLERHFPERDGVVADRYGVGGDLQAGQALDMAGVMPFDVMIGRCNPVALPLTLEFEPPKAIGHATFTAPYEGAPGCVHGAVLAGAFDLVLTAANVIAGAAGPTVTLSRRTCAALRLSIMIVRWRVTQGAFAGTRNSVIPSRSSRPPELRAATIKTSATWPSRTNAFCPLSR